MKYSLNIITQFFKAEGIPSFETEYKFHKTRRWKMDFAWPDYLVALEVEGGVWIGGRHTRPTGFLKDCEKYNTAAVLGWRILRVTPDQLMRRETIHMIKSALALDLTSNKTP